MTAGNNSPYYAGRPTKLTEEMLEKAASYLSTCEDTIHFTEKGAVSYVDVKLPSKVGLAQFLGINKDTITEWQKSSTPFSVIVKSIEQEQEKRLLNSGLGGLYAPKVLGMVLSKHGYYEKTQADVTSNGQTVGVNPVISELTKKLNDLHRGTDSGGDGESSGSMGSEAPNQE